MEKYVYLQGKRLLRYLAGALCVVTLLVIGLWVAFSVLVQQASNAEENKPVAVAMVGTADDAMLQMGLAAMKSFDATRFSMKLVEMNEEEARAALADGRVGAYVVFPEGFLEEAMMGNILPLKFVSTTGAAGMVSVLKDEVGAVISTLLLESQKAVYGMHMAMLDENVDGRGEKMTELAIMYVEYVMVRDRVYQISSLGIADELTLEDYLLCGLAVVLLHLAGLPFAPLMIRKDLSLCRMLAARGKSAIGQAFCDLGIYLAGMLALVAVLLVGASFIAELPKDLFWVCLPVVLLVCSFSFMLYALSGDLIGGVLLQFFAAAGMCFISGCMYPVHFFPVSVQKLAAWLPAALARSMLGGCITGQQDGRVCGLLLAWCGLFVAVGIVARVRAVKEARV